MASSTAEPGCVTAESFGKFLQYFGPLSDSHDIVSNVRRVVSQKFVFGPAFFLPPSLLTVLASRRTDGFLAK